jgi:hypothetical protein
MTVVQPTFVQPIKTTNDVNGNSRRAYVVYGLRTDDMGSFLQVVDVVQDYYGGPAWIKTLPAAEAITVAPAEYRRFLKMCAMMTEAHSR